MSKLEQAAKQLLEHWDTPLWKQTEMTGTYINALREALAEQAEQHPVAWILEGGNCVEFEYRDYHDGDEWTPLYTAPVRTKDLTDDEIAAIVRKAAIGYAINRDGLTSHHIARAVIAAFKEKNK